MNGTIDTLRSLIARHAGDGQTSTGIARFSLTRREAVTGPVARLIVPRMCLVVQGAKVMTVGGKAMEYGSGQYLLASVDVPAIDRVSRASRSEPYLGLLFDLDPAILAALLLDLPVLPHQGVASGLDIGVAEPELLDAFLRLVRLLDRPQDIALIAPLIEREILLRLLQGPHGTTLRQMAELDSRLSQIRRATAWIRENYARSFRVEELAARLGMSATSLHRHFKASTQMTPIQYQKQYRLYQARQRLLAAPGNAAGVAFAVGYESASQFSREYARLFGTPPARDARQLRGAFRLAPAEA